MTTELEYLIAQRERAKELKLPREAIRALSDIIHRLCWLQGEYPKAYAEFCRLDMNDPRDRAHARKLRGIKRVK
jgi:hypothetical protein